jgi:zinc transporter ZupT
MAFVFGIAAFVATLLGGSFALRFKDRLHLILGFSAGAVIGVAFFDLIPEAIERASKRFDVPHVTSIVAVGFIIFMILDRMVILHSHSHTHSDYGPEHDHDVHDHSDQSRQSRQTLQRGRLGAGSLSIHSFLDGAAIGLAFKVSREVGIVVTIAVLVHDFSDGINTVNMVLKNGGSSRQAFRWLLADAIAPVLGVASTRFFSPAESTLGVILALFAGFFLYIGASDLLPESHHAHPTMWTTISTIGGVVVLYAAIQIAGM